MAADAAQVSGMAPSGHEIRRGGGYPKWAPARVAGAYENADISKKACNQGLIKAPKHLPPAPQHHAAPVRLHRYFCIRDHAEPTTRQGPLSAMRGWPS
jgi:hypothetical protein